ncbi:hypothetical protein PSTG_10308 [Puccinia striiformis f. sp. tritici PST-78]|uniref:Uncharacterized protein n=1 Tax=Puccinia striiformis f. sp. tritici PST-78 TaxID=1165861 RepID=A0A0L0VAV8_9BASI|nr:hypothetical protein PSTG_10308 [Puccinia striiformis f. sp. tritici PST-78]
MEKQELNVQHEEQIKSLKTRHETQLIDVGLGNSRVILPLYKRNINSKLARLRAIIGHKSRLFPSVFPIPTLLPAQSM